MFKRIILVQCALCLIMLYNISSCPSETNSFDSPFSPKLPLRSLESYTSSTSKWNSTLSDKERKSYEEMISLKDSFASSTAFLPQSFSPEDKEYWNRLNYIVIVFILIAAIPFVFILFYLIVRFVCNKCRGPTKLSQVSRFYRNCSWVVVAVGIIGVILCLTIILIYSSMANSKVISSLNTSVDIIQKIKETDQPIRKVISKVQSAGTPIVFSDNSLENYKKGVNDFVQTARNRTDDAIKDEKNRNLASILVFIAVLILCILIFVFFFFRLQKGLTVLSILTLLLIPGMIVLMGFNAKYYFYYSDMCGAVNKAMYKEEFPVAGKGIGFYINCLDSKTKSQLYKLNYQLNEAKIKFDAGGKEESEIIDEIEKVREEQINYVVECNNVYDVIEKMEGDFCYKGMEWLAQIISCFTWLLIFLLVLGLGIGRLEVLIWKKNLEIRQMIENQEALY